MLRIMQIHQPMPRFALILQLCRAACSAPTASTAWTAQTWCRCTCLHMLTSVCPYLAWCLGGACPVPALRHHAASQIEGPIALLSTLPPQHPLPTALLPPACLRACWARSSWSTCCRGWASCPRRPPCPRPSQRCAAGTGTHDLAGVQDFSSEPAGPSARLTSAVQHKGATAFPAWPSSLSPRACWSARCASLPRVLQVDARFRVLWADHGDEVSRQYAGTVRGGTAQQHMPQSDFLSLQSSSLQSCSMWSIAVLTVPPAARAAGRDEERVHAHRQARHLGPTGRRRQVADAVGDGGGAARWLGGAWAACANLCGRSTRHVAIG